jgi:hypothetical protein
MVLLCCLSFFAAGATAQQMTNDPTVVQGTVVDAHVDLGRLDTDLEMGSNRRNGPLSPVSQPRRENQRQRPFRIGSGLEYRSIYQSLLGMTPTVGILIEF